MHMQCLRPTRIHGLHFNKGSVNLLNFALPSASALGERFLARTCFTDSRFFSGHMQPSQSRLPIYRPQFREKRYFSTMDAIKLSKSSNRDPIFRNYTPVQLSRAGGAAIRTALVRGSLWEAFHLWHSMRWSVSHYGGSKSRFTPPSSKFQPIDFGRAVSPSFAGHCLLHGLIRLKDRRLASKLAMEMIEDGIRLRTRTRDILFRDLGATGNVLIPRKPFRSLLRPPTLKTCRPSDPLAECVTVFIHHAHRHRWQRTYAMYEKAINLCLLQSEILVASILLALLLHDYQMHVARSQVNNNQAFADEDSTSVPKNPRRLHWYGPGSAVGPWSQRHTHAIVDALEPHILAGPEDDHFDECSQSLAILASAMGSRRLPPHRLNKLIALLYSYPECETHVWILDSGGVWRRTRAYMYFHEVLKHFIESLPTNIPSSLPREPWLQDYYGGRRSLDIGTYNALIQYAVIERKSFSMLQRVLNHMQDVRQPPMPPNTVTYNIVLRGCRLARRNDLAELIWQKLACMSAGKTDELCKNESQVPLPPDEGVNGIEGSNGSLGGMDTSSPDVSKKLVNTATGDSTSSACAFPVARECRSVRLVIRDNEKLSVTMPKPNGSIAMDVYMLVAYIQHLVASGRPAAVARIFYQLFPELLVDDRSRKQRENAVKRAILYGPEFFAAVISALRKAGKTGTAERIWGFAMSVEAASWESPTPWVLHVHAYTAMLALYGDEARRGLTRLSARHPNASKRVALGWGRHTPRSMKAALSITNRGLAGRTMGLVIYDRFMTMSVPSTVPFESRRPDARFFNAALRLLTFDLSVRRALRRRQSNHAVARSGLCAEETSLSCPPELQRVIQDISVAGYTVPRVYREAFAAHSDLPAMSAGVTTELLPGRPYIFGRPPRVTTWDSFTIKTVKTKGLPIRNRRYRRRLSKKAGEY